MITMRGSIFTEGVTACSIFGTGGTVNGNAFNVDAADSCVGATDDDDYENTLASLGGLGDNGGPTETKALFGPSELFNAAGACTQLDGSTPLLVDQRGAPRPSEGACEPGSYERSFCNGVLFNAPGPYVCPAPPDGTTGGGTTQPATQQPVTTQPATVPNPLCAPLRKKLKAAKKRGDKPKIRKLRRKLRNLGC